MVLQRYIDGLVSNVVCLWLQLVAILIRCHRSSRILQLRSRKADAAQVLQQGHVGVEGIQDDAGTVEEEAYGVAVL